MATRADAHWGSNGSGQRSGVRAIAIGSNCRRALLVALPYAVRPPRPDWQTFRIVAEQQPAPDSVLAEQPSGRGSPNSPPHSSLPYRSVLEDEDDAPPGRDDAATALLVRQCAYLKSEVASLFARLVSFEGPSVDIVLVFNTASNTPHTWPSSSKTASTPDQEGCTSRPREFGTSPPCYGTAGEWHRTLARELARVSSPTTRGLPLWLEEGLVALVEQELARRELVYSKPAAGSCWEGDRRPFLADARPGPLLVCGEAFLGVEAQEHAYRPARGR